MFETLTQDWLFWIIAAVLVGYGCLLLYRGLLRDRWHGRPRCPKCWYDLSGAPTTPATHPATAALTVLPVACPECGRIAKTHRQLHRTRRNWFTVFLGVILLSQAVYIYEVRHRMIHAGESWKTAFIPSTAYILGLQWIEKPTFEVVEARFVNRMLPNKGQPNGHGFWTWQDRLFQDALSRVVENGKAPLHSDALHLLLRMANEGDAHALRLFISHLDHPDGALRLQAMNWAQSIGDKMLAGREEVFARLKDEDLPVRQAAAWVLARLGPEQHAGLSDEKLCEVAGELLVINWGEGQPCELYLTEMIRRRSPTITQWLRVKAADAPKLRHGDGPANLGILTALRRIERATDPLVIEIEPTHTATAVRTTILWRGSEPRYSPVMKATIRNREKIPIGFQRHGDNRGERPMRWRFEVRDTQGKLMPLDLESTNFGGISSFGPLKPGETFEIDLDMSKFVCPLPPGEYRVTVQYHDALQISSMADVTGLIILESKEVKMVVEP